jgi:hypothetical protein
MFQQTQNGHPLLENGRRQLHREFNRVLLQPQQMRLLGGPVCLDPSPLCRPEPLTDINRYAHHDWKHHNEEQRWHGGHRCSNHIVPEHGLVPRFNLRCDDADIGYVRLVTEADHLSNGPEIQVLIALHEHHLL